MSNKDKGKCFSKVNKGQRNKSDFYQTPYLMTESLFQEEIFDGEERTMLEPASGNGAITKVLIKNFKGKIYSYDINKEGINFLKETNSYNYMITNPPFSLANEFIIHAKKIIQNKFCLLMPLGYLQGQWRYENIYNKRDSFLLKHIYVFTRMPMLSDEIREDGKYKTGMQPYAWFVWIKERYKSYNHPIINWVDSKNHIVRK